MSEKRRNLDYDVVLFLMSIEVERMSSENSKLKYQIQVMEDKNLDRNSYEHQIIDLKQRLDQLLDEKDNLM